MHGQGENPLNVADFAAQTGVSFPLVPDVGNTLGKFDFPPGVNFPYPRDVVIGKDLVVRSIKNSFDVAEMDALVEQLVNE